MVNTSAEGNPMQGMRSNLFRYGTNEKLKSDMWQIEIPTLRTLMFLKLFMGPETCLLIKKILKKSISHKCCGTGPIQQV